MRIAAWLMLCAALAACELLPAPQQSQPASKPPPSAEQMARALTLLNRAFQENYERILQEHGTRTYATERGATFDALDASLRRLGMIVESRDADVGTLTVAAPAPRPLSAAEWRQVAEADTPLMASITCPILGEYCRGIRFEPDDYVIVINATVLDMPSGGARVSLTTRMREIMPRPGAPRRDYPPPTGVRMALDKIWGQLEREIADRRSRTR